MRRKRSAIVFAVMFGFCASGLLLYFFQDTRLVLAEAVEYQLTVRKIRQLNPQSREELWDCIRTAVTLESNRSSPFRLHTEDVIDLLLKESSDSSGRGTSAIGYKLWASEDLRNNMIISVNEIHRQGMGYFPMSSPDEEWQRSKPAIEAWNHQVSFWGQVGAALIAGAGVAVILLTFAPFVGVVVVVLFLVSTRVGGRNVENVPQTTINVVDEQGGGERLESPQHDTPVLPVTGMVWPIVVAVFLSAFVVELRGGFQILRNWLSRAPPFTVRKECVMRFAVSLVLVIGLFAPAVSFAAPDSTRTEQSVYLQFGEWPNGRGSGATWVIVSGRFTHLPFVFLDGSVFEGFTLLQACSSPLSLSFGPVVGTLNERDGAEPYAGFEVRGRMPAGQLSMPFRFATRHTQTTRLHHLVIAGLQYRTGASAFGASYQPIRTEGPWQQRLALSAEHRFRWFTLILEGRMSLDRERRTSLNLDVSIPLR